MKFEAQKLFAVGFNIKKLLAIREISNKYVKLKTFSGLDQSNCSHTIPQLQLRLSIHNK